MNESIKLLTNNEEKLMEIFWKSNRPLTSIEILETSGEYSWTASYVHGMLRSIQKKGILEVCGTVQCGKQYARQFIPTITKEEYAAKLALSTGIGKHSIAKVTVAMVKETENKEELIRQLEDIIEELKQKD